MVSGNPDLIILLEDGSLMPIEIKSIKKGSADDEKKKDPKSFVGLTAPSSSYVKQVCRYTYLLRRKGFKVSDYGKIIYACKEYMFKAPYKEFTIDTTDRKNILSFNEETYQLTEFNKYRETGELPVRELCSSMLIKFARDCPACNTCFKE